MDQVRGDIIPIESIELNSDTEVVMETFNGAMAEGQRKRAGDVEAARGIYRRERHAGDSRRLTPHDAAAVLAELYPEMLQGY